MKLLPILTYLANRGSTPLSGNCWANNFGYGCKVYVQGHNQWDDKPCKMTGDEMWLAYQEVRKVGGCSRCGSKHIGNGCLLSIDYEGNCDNRDSGPDVIVNGTDW